MDNINDEEIKQALVGMHYIQAHRYVAQLGLTLRVVRKDGQALVTTRDYRLDRVNVELADERVTVVRDRG